MLHTLQKEFRRLTPFSDLILGLITVMEAVIAQWEHIASLRPTELVAGMLREPSAPHVGCFVPLAAESLLIVIFQKNHLHTFVSSLESEILDRSCRTGVQVTPSSQFMCALLKRFVQQRNSGCCCAQVLVKRNVERGRSHDDHALQTPRAVGSRSHAALPSCLALFLRPRRVSVLKCPV